MQTLDSLFKLVNLLLDEAIVLKSFNMNDLYES